MKHMCFSQMFTICGDGIAVLDNNVLVLQQRDLRRGRDIYQPNIKSGIILR